MFVSDVNARGAQDETTPLHMACRYNSGSVTQLLLTQGAEVNVRDIKGKTPLHYATRRGNDVPTKVHVSGSVASVKATWSVRGFLFLLQNHVNQYKL